jgi:hypothetical protein
MPFLSFFCLQCRVPTFEKLLAVEEALCGCKLFQRAADKEAPQTPLMSQCRTASPRKRFSASQFNNPRIPPPTPRHRPHNLRWMQKNHNTRQKPGHFSEMAHTAPRRTIPHHAAPCRTCAASVVTDSAQRNWGNLPCCIRLSTWVRQQWILCGTYAARVFNLWISFHKWWPIANEHKKKAQDLPENGIKGRINIFEVKAYSSGNYMNVSVHVYIVHCSRYIRSKQVTPKAA